MSLRYSLFALAALLLAALDLRGSRLAAEPQRVPWTTSRVRGTPEPPPPYTVERAFAQLTFEQPIHLLRGPWGERLYVLERQGRIVSFEDRQEADATHVFMEAGAGEPYSFAFHPRFPATPYIYMLKNERRDDAQGRRAFNRILRYETTTTQPPSVLPETALLILEFISDGHNGGDVVFGPDGYLYVTCGDGTGDSDGWVTGQDVSDLLATMLRLDVDTPDGEQPYSVPADNPFVGREGVVRRSGPTVSAIPGASPSTRRVVISTSATSGRTSGR